MVQGRRMGRRGKNILVYWLQVYMAFIEGLLAQDMNDDA